jgi:hypothetical protein
VVATGRGDDAHSGWLARQKVREGAAGLERAGVLQLLEFQRQRERRQPEVGTADGDNGVRRM